MELRDIIKFAKRAGWTVTKNREGHPEFWAPGADRDDRPTVTGSGTSSDWRAVPNLVSELRKAGLDIPHKGRQKKKGQR